VSELFFAAVQSNDKRKLARFCDEKGALSIVIVVACCGSVITDNWEAREASPMLIGSKERTLAT